MPRQESGWRPRFTLHSPARFCTFHNRVYTARPRLLEEARYGEATSPELHLPPPTAACRLPSTSCSCLPDLSEAHINHMNCMVHPFTACLVLGASCVDPHLPALASSSLPWGLTSLPLRAIFRAEIWAVSAWPAVGMAGPCAGPWQHGVNQVMALALCFWRHVPSTCTICTVHLFKNCNQWSSLLCLCLLGQVLLGPRPQILSPEPNLKHEPQVH